MGSGTEGKGVGNSNCLELWQDFDHVFNLLALTIVHQELKSEEMSNRPGKF
jgi:hypothetical protein